MAGQRYSPVRRAARVIVWVALCVVLCLRQFVYPPDPEFSLGALLDVGTPERSRPVARPTLSMSPANRIPGDLPRLCIDVEPGDAQVLRGYHWSGWRGRAQERPEVVATVREDHRVYPYVVLHLKGAAGSFRPFDDKPAMTLNFAQYDRPQRFRGYSKLSLNNSVQDPSYLCEVVSREMFEAAGIPAPRAEFATVVVNGIDKGLYVMVEGYNKAFLRRHFRDVRGNLYDGGFCQDIDTRLQVNSGDWPEERRALEALVMAAAEPDPAQRWAALVELLDMERFISLLAMEVLTAHWDGYALNRNNYRIFHDLETDRLVFMPHGLDQMFGWPPGRYPPEASIQPGMQGLVARAVMTTPEGSALYWQRLGQLATNFFHEAQIVGRIRELAARVRPTLTAYGEAAAQEHDLAVEALCGRVGERLRSVAEQLRQPREALEFDDAGSAALGGWKPVRFGRGAWGVDYGEGESEGSRWLGVMIGDRRRSGSWRTRVYLEPGRYLFEGRVRLEGDEGEAMAGLRVGGQRGMPSFVGKAGLTWIRHPFFVEGGLTEVELMCELAGRRAEAWFEVDSLRLIRE